MICHSVLPGDVDSIYTFADIMSVDAAGAEEQCGRGICQKIAQILRSANW